MQNGQQQAAISFNVGDALAIVKRRLWFFVVPTVLILMAVVPIALLLPREYRSKAIILIEQPDIPPELVSSTVTTLADQRIQVIEQRFKATANLVRVIDKYNLYPDARDADPISAIVERMRDKITVELISANVMDPRGGRPRKATIAFSLNFDYAEPVTTQKVTSELVTWYLNENTRERQEQAQQTAAFLSTEAVALERTMADLEARVAKFKEKYAGTLPEELQINTEALNRAEQEVRDLDLRAASLADRRSVVEMEMGYLASYVPLPTQQGGGAAALSPAMQLKVAQAQLQDLQGSYAEGHPDIVKLRNKIAGLEAQVAADRKTPPQAGSTGGGGGEEPDSLRRLQLKTQMQTLDSEARALAKRRDTLNAEIVAIRERLARTPLVEQEYKVLTRSLENAQADYLALRGKRLSATLGESLETEGKGERFDVIEPPTLPVAPERPNRPLIIAGGAAFALAFGAAMMVLAELLDPTIRGQRYLLAKTGVRPLGFVPYIRTRAERMRMWQRRIAVGTAMLASLAGGLAYVHYKVKPLDVAMVTLERRLDSQFSRILR